MTKKFSKMVCQMSSYSFVCVVFGLVTNSQICESFVVLFVLFSAFQIVHGTSK